MGLRESNSIDIIIHPLPNETEPCKIIFIIVDGSADLSDAERFTLLVRKVSAYAGYTLSPEFREQHPGLTPGDVLIRVLTVTLPTQQMLGLHGVRAREPGQDPSSDAPFLRVSYADYHEFMRTLQSGSPKPRSNN